MKITAKTVALALAKANKLAGQQYNAEKTQSIKERAANLTQDLTPYGPYVADGDPQDWGGGHALVTIYMEPKGCKDDCIMPLSYYGDGFEVACKASDLLPGNAYIEFINAAVACVYNA